MAWLYGLDERTTADLIDAAKRANTAAWWQPYKDALPEWFTTYAELEQTATSLRTFQAALVPGLMQTPEYHRAVFDADSRQPASDREQHVEFRVKRQRAAFDRPDPLQAVAVLSEAVLACEVGGSAVMAEQREHLLALSRRPRIEILVIPFSAGAHAGLAGGAFSVLGFENPDDPDVAYVETRVGARYTEEPETLRAYLADFDQVRELTVPVEEYLR